MKKLLPLLLVTFLACTKENNCVTCEKYQTNNAEEVAKRYNGMDYDPHLYQYDGTEKEYIYCVTEQEREMWMKDNGLVIDSGLIAPDDDTLAYVKLVVECYREE